MELSWTTIHIQTGCELWTEKNDISIDCWCQPNKKMNRKVCQILSIATCLMINWFRECKWIIGTMRIEHLFSFDKKLSNILCSWRFVRLLILFLKISYLFSRSIVTNYCTTAKFKSIITNFGQSKHSLFSHNIIKLMIRPFGWFLRLQQLLRKIYSNVPVILLPISTIMPTDKNYNPKIMFKLKH